MIIKNWKVIIAGTLIFIFNGLIIGMILRINNKIQRVIKNSTDYRELMYLSLEQHMKYINKFNENLSIQINHISKIYVILDIFKINMPYAIQKTTTKIATIKDVMSHRDINLTLLQYIEEEYRLMKIGILNKIENCGEELEKNKFQYMINEINNITTLLQTLSKDSSDEYIDHLFKEIVNSINNFKNI